MQTLPCAPQSFSMPTTRCVLPPSLRLFVPSLSWQTNHRFSRKKTQNRRRFVLSQVPMYANPGSFVKPAKQNIWMNESRLVEVRARNRKKRHRFILLISSGAPIILPRQTRDKARRKLNSKKHSNPPGFSFAQALEGTSWMTYYESARCEHVSFFELSLCLSRACLGKMIF